MAMSDGSRGAFDWTWNPSGSVTCSAARTVVPAPTASLSTSGTISAGMRFSCAPASDGTRQATAARARALSRMITSMLPGLRASWRAAGNL